MYVQRVAEIFAKDILMRQVLKGISNKESAQQCVVTSSMISVNKEETKEMEERTKVGTTMYCRKKKV